MAPTSIALIALLGWAPLVLSLYAVLPPRRAMVAGAVAGWLLLPSINIDLPGLPPFGKATAIIVGILLGTLIFEPGRAMGFRPRWYDLPMLVWCLCPFATSISNNLGAYDGVSAAFRQTINWFFPYLIGRLYLTKPDDFRELALGMIVGATCMVPIAFLEMRIGAQLQRRIYGTGGWEGTRFGLYRPTGFLTSGLELGLWMFAATLMAWWLWRCGQFKRLWGMPAGTVVNVLLITSIAIRATGATILTLMGFVTLRFCMRSRTKWLMWCLLAIAPVYHYVRISNLWTGRDLIAWVYANVDKKQGRSLEARFEEEDILIARALVRPILGWGGYNRCRPADQWGNLVLIDSYWNIAMGMNGCVGLESMTIAMILPVILFLRRFPVERWDHPDLAPATIFTVIVSLFLLDGLANAMFNMLYIIAAGGLVNIVPARIGPCAPEHDSKGTAAVVRPRSVRHDEAIVEAPTRFLMPEEDLAARYQALGRAAKNRGRAAEAKGAWQHALDFLTEQTAIHPESSSLRRRWCDCANDLSWLLASVTDPAVRDPARAVALAAAATEAGPECAAYWNTLGAALYRAGDFAAAVVSLDRATALGDGGSPFDFLFLAMAHSRLGYPEDAQRWFARAVIELERCPSDHPELRRLRDEAEAILPSVPAAAL